MGRGACKFHQPAAHVYIACADLEKEETQYKDGYLHRWAGGSISMSLLDKEWSKVGSLAQNLGML